MRILRHTIAIACLLLTLFGLGLQDSNASERGNYISHGPILGRVSAQGIGVWARTGHSGPFQVKYGLSPDKMDQLSKPVVTTLNHDNTAWIHITGLNANT
ncbi:MAG: hypothetical protein IH899_11285, partial [Planctomycetes bacterium]|nr:hypothetical protein [Planctomycetota bacterium]